MEQMMQKELLFLNPLFFKQWGGVRRNEAGRLIDGRTWDGFPAAAEHLRRS